MCQMRPKWLIPSRAMDSPPARGYMGAAMTDRASPDSSSDREGQTNGKKESFNDLMPMVYEELRQRAANYLRSERPGHTLQPTALVNETYLRLLRQERI